MRLCTQQQKQMITQMGLSFAAAAVAADIIIAWPGIEQEEKEEEEEEEERKLISWCGQTDGRTDGWSVELGTSASISIEAIC